MLFCETERNFGRGGESAGVKSRWMKIGNWLDTAIAIKDCNIGGERSDWEEGITRYSAWLYMLAETQTCWVRLMGNNKYVHFWEKESIGLSNCILKYHFVMKIEMFEIRIERR